MNLAAAFDQVAVSVPDKTAVFWGEHTFSYRQLKDESDRVAGHLEGTHRISRGDRVGLWLHNCPQFITALFGVLKTGAVAVPINNFLKPHEVAYILKDAGIRVLVVDAGMQDSLPRLAEEVPGLQFIFVNDFAGLAPAPACRSTPEALAESDLAVLIYTSGTTGHPKGAMLTHGNLLHNVHSCRLELEAVQLDRFALVLPMFHSFMLTVCILLPLLVGGTIVLVKSLNPPKNIFHEITVHQATVLPAIPQLFRTLAHAPVPPSLSLRLCISGAAPLPLETLRTFSERWPVPLIEGYGLSETSPVASLNPIRGVRKPGSIGLPITNVELSIRNDAGQELPRNTTGEVCVRGGNVMAGYWNRPEETREALRDGWLYTGDIGHMDDDGYSYITDRKKDMLLVNGINVYPREIEEVMYEFPGIREAAVIGRPDPRKGEQPVAFLALNDGAALDEPGLLHFLRERLADYKLPKHVIVLPALPRTATGKILKTSLRQMKV
jgi:long-chain acyl-CoA synthetase